MTPLKLILHPDAVNEYLTEHGLPLEGYAPIEAAMLQPGGTVEGHPAVMLAIRVDGRLVLAKTTLRLLDAAVTNMLVSTPATYERVPYPPTENDDNDNTDTDTTH